MVTIHLEFYHVLIIIVTTYLAKELVMKVFLPVLFRTKFMVRWQIDREMSKRRKVQEAKSKLISERFKILEEFVAHVDKQLANNHARKLFWRDFARSPSTRSYWLKKFEEQIAPKKKQEGKLSKGYNPPPAVSVRPQKPTPPPPPKTEKE